VEKDRPKFGLKNNEKTGVYGIHRPADDRAPIPRQIEKLILGAANPSAGQRLPGGGPGRHHPRLVRESSTQLLDERHRGKHLTDAHRMNPDRPIQAL
jgi:hypothetical protein